MYVLMQVEQYETIPVIRFDVLFAAPNVHHLQMFESTIILYNIMVLFNEMKLSYVIFTTRFFFKTNVK